jgi:sulfopyruvate decarboxylase TPP-binding subunit
MSIDNIYIFETYDLATMVILSKLVIHRNDIHVQKLCNNVDELLESCNIKSYLHKGQDNKTNLLKRPCVLINL